MEGNVIPTQVRIYSQSALHSFITGPGASTTRPKSKVSPYRKSQGFMSFLGLKDVLDEVRREEADAQDQKVAAQVKAREDELSWSLGQVSEA